MVRNGLLIGTALVVAATGCGASSDADPADMAASTAPASSSATRATSSPTTTTQPARPDGTAMSETTTTSAVVAEPVEVEQRIIPVDGDLAEIVFALGLGDAVVATDISATYPEAADELPEIGYQRALAAEPIIAFEPTIVLATDIAGPEETLDDLERLGVEVVMVPSETHLMIPRAVTTSQDPHQTNNARRNTHVNSLERLRLAVALGHTVPGAELRLTTERAERVVVSAHPAADIDPCAMRRIVMAASCPEVADCSERVHTIAFAGSLQEIGGGVFRVVRHGAEQRWIASVLKPDVVSDLLDLVGIDDIPADAMHGCLKPDSELGVTMLVITSNDSQYDHALDEIAAQAAASMFAEELLRSATRDGARDESAGAERRGGAS